MADHRPTDLAAGWEQTAAFGPTHLRLDLIIHLDGPDGSAGFSIERRDGINQQRVSLVVKPHVALGSVAGLAMSDMLTVLEEALRELAPF